MGSFSYNNSKSANLFILFGMLMVVCLPGCGKKQDVEVVQPRRSDIQESFSEPAKTWLEDIYPITMPISGRINRIEFQPGDQVEKGTLLVKFDETLLAQQVMEASHALSELQAELKINADDRIEQTALVEVYGIIQAASETLSAAAEEIRSEKARLDRNQKELQRVRNLTNSGAATERQLDDAELTALTSEIDYRRQVFYQAAIKALVKVVHLGPRYIENYLGLKKLRRAVLLEQVRQAQARLMQVQHQLKLARSITAPISGVVLERYSQGDAFLSAGEPLLSIGFLGDLQVEADVLTQQALQLESRTPVEFSIASLPQTVTGVVTKIEPSGFTKFSSLGVEQQRVKVIMSIDTLLPGLGVGYRLQARFITGNKQQALVVPRFSVLQDSEGNNYVFKVAGNKLVRQNVELGLQSDLELEIVEGLSVDDRIVAHPDTSLSEGDSVRATTSR